MEKYDFDTVVPRRGTNSYKWDTPEQEGVLPMWVADMDFRAAPCIVEALRRRVSHGVFGYTRVPAAYYDAVTDWFARRHGWRIDPHWILYTTGVVPALSAVIKALTVPGDRVIVQTPAYNCFYSSIRNNGCELLANRLRYEGGAYTIDFDDLETKASDPKAKLLLLCNPHNPVSRAWKREELQALIDLLARYGAYLIADEIHADFVYAPEQFVPVLSLAQKNVLSLCAASKTFNLAGLEQAAMLVPDEAVRAKINTEMERAGVRSGNLFALEGTRAAYEYGDAWLDGLMRYLDGNRKHLTAVVKQELPQAVLTPMEATYLGWLDLRAYGMNCEELMARTLKHGVQFTEGTFFGEGGEGFLRVNIGCPRRNITEGIRRLKEALDEAVEEKVHGVD